jgi:hypothetical protein
MSHTKQASKRKRRSKTVPVLGAAGLSLSLASGASTATTAPAADMLTRTPAGHEIRLTDEEISDVSLATFYVYDKENAATLRPGRRLAGAGCACGGCAGCACLGGCGGCWTGTNYTSSVYDGGTNPPPQLVKPAHKRAHKHAQVPKNP